VQESVEYTCLEAVLEAILEVRYNTIVGGSLVRQDLLVKSGRTILKLNGADGRQLAHGLLFDVKKRRSLQNQSIGLFESIVAMDEPIGVAGDEPLLKFVREGFETIACKRIVLVGILAVVLNQQLWQKIKSLPVALDLGRSCKSRSNQALASSNKGSSADAGAFLMPTIVWHVCAI